MEFFANPKVWVGASFFLFVALMWKPVGRAIASALDDRADKIREELSEATRLREEAQAILLSYQKRQQEVMKEAEELLANAKANANRMAAKAEEDLKKLVESRRKQAMDAIAQAETKAMQDVRDHVVDIAMSAARSLVKEHLSKGSADQLTALAISDIQRKIH